MNVSPQRSTQQGELANKRLLASGNERRMGRVHHKLQSETNAAKIKQLASVVFEQQ